MKRNDSNRTKIRLFISGKEMAKNGNFENKEKIPKFPRSHSESFRIISTDLSNPRFQNKKQKS